MCIVVNSGVYMMVVLLLLKVMVCRFKGEFREEWRMGRVFEYT